MSKDGKLEHQERSPTAATAGDDRYKPSGAMVYRVMVSTGIGFQFEDVKAATGDDAAAKALEKFPGCKVAHVAPAPRQTEDA